jgi:hypothetical protein
MIGVFVGLLAIAVWGTWYGYQNGYPIGQPLPPGPEAALKSAFVCATYFGWMGAFAGGVIGGAAGLGSALVRAISSSSRSPRPAPSA